MSIIWIVIIVHIVGIVRSQNNLYNEDVLVSNYSYLDLHKCFPWENVIEESKNIRLKSKIFVDFSEYKSLRDFSCISSSIKDKYQNLFLDELTIQEILSSKTNILVFFVRKEAILKMKRFIVWEEMNFNDFILIPLDSLFINNHDCQFFSHFWRTKNHPDPDGYDLELLKQHLRQDKITKYVWIDYCCIPQHLDHEIKQRYFEYILTRIPVLIQECSFNFFYIENDVRNRVWIFYEMMLYNLIHVKKLPITEDNEKYYNFMLKFLSENNLLEDFFVRNDFKTASEDDLTYIIKYLTIFMKLGSIIDDIAQIHELLDNLNFLTTSSEYLIGSLNYSPLSLDIDFNTAQVIFRNQYFVEINYKKLLYSFIGKNYQLVESKKTTKSNNIAIYANILLSIKNVLDYGEGETLCREIGQNIYIEWGHQGMVLVCEYIRDKLGNRIQYRSVERAWDGIGEWLG